MFLLSELPDSGTMETFATRFPEMEIDTTAACLRILKVASVLLRELDHHFSNHGLSQARFLALVVLERQSKGELMPVEIARQMGVSKKNTARLLAAMKEDGLVTLTAHMTDGRALVAQITGKGFKLLARVLPGYYKILNGALVPLNAKSKRGVIAALDLVLAGMDKAFREASPSDSRLID